MSSTKSALHGQVSLAQSVFSVANCLRHVCFSKETFLLLLFRNKLTSYQWGAEENGLLGSKYYTQNLNATQANNILAYLNFDMVSRGTFNVFDGDGSSYNVSGAPGSDKIEKLFVDHLTGNGINVTAAVFTGGSDYKSFMEIGKPVGGMNTGTAPSQDPCYHQACDTIDNPNPNTITVISKVCIHTTKIRWEVLIGTRLLPMS